MKTDIPRTPLRSACNSRKEVALLSFASGPATKVLLRSSLKVNGLNKDGGTTECKNATPSANTEIPPQDVGNVIQLAHTHTSSD